MKNATLHRLHLDLLRSEDVSEIDQYGRLLRYVVVDDLYINYELVHQGYAATVTFPPDVACTDTFLEAEQIARMEGKGLWGEQPNQ